MKLGQDQVKEAVNHPDHYKMHKVECIDAIEDVVRHIPNGNHAFLTGQVLKYMWRWYFKHDSPQKRHEDLQKARWYLDRLIKDVDPTPPF